MMIHGGEDLRLNGSGVKDPTAYKAIKRADKRYNPKVKHLIETLHNVAHLAGYEIVGRIEIKDKNTGETWR